MRRGLWNIKVLIQVWGAYDKLHQLRLLAFILVTAASASSAAAGEATYVGAAACAKCHAEAYQKWSGSRHSKMLQPAGVKSVKGDFSRGAVKLRGETYQLQARGGVYYITESYLTGKPVEHRVDYTLGSRRVQHYLTTTADGKIIVLPPSWDVLRKQWFHNFDIGDPDESGDVEIQLWNKQCFSCHVSQEEKHFDTGTIQYKTSWTNFGTNCERCHGPGSEHVARYAAEGGDTGSGGAVVVQTRLDASRNTMVCAQCHSFRDIFVPGYAAGEDYYDYFLPILEFDQPVAKYPAYWPDGRTRRFSSDALGLWQSQCFLKGGATCTMCHGDAHDTEIEKNAAVKPEATAICGRCHAAEVKNAAAHSHHAAGDRGQGSAGANCVECHMPRTVQSVKAEIRDHSMSIPAPENTVRHQIPNACNQCHKDRDGKWAARQVEQWWGGGKGEVRRRQAVRRADTFVAARKGDAAVVGALAEMAGDATENPLSRANAVGYLSRYSGNAQAYPAMERALGDASPLVRAVAALRMNAVGEARAKAAMALTQSLGDASAVVRLAAAVNLTGMGIKTLPGVDGERLEAARGLYRKRAELNTDDAAQQMSVGRFFLLLNDPARAAEALALSMRIDPQTPAGYFLGYAYAAERKYAEAREVLGKVGRGDAQYGKAQELLKAIAGR